MSKRVIVLGCVIKGKTKHFDLICLSVTQTLLNLSIKNKKPIGNGILPCFNISQALERSNPNKKDKGGEANTRYIFITVQNQPANR